ncbi:MAG: hypothetical protein HY252_17720 [Sphingobacteriales bacterium]|nr:hypothetical protein [Sphingobacteriales bacterium]
MTDKLFDDFFKQKLEYYDSGSPMYVWEKVRRELHEADDDKGVVWWKNPLWLLALLLFIGGGITIGVIGKNNNWFNKPTAVENIAGTKNSNQQNDAAVVPATPNSASKENSSTSSTEKTDDSNITLTSSDKTPTITNTVSSNNEKVDISPAAEVKTKKAAIRKLIRKAKHQSQEPIAGLPVSNKAVANLNTFTDDQPAINNPIDRDVNLSVAEGTSKTSLKSLLESQKLKTAIPFNPRTFTGCPTIGPPRRNDLYLEVYGAADNVTRNLTGTPATPSEYIDTRKQAEKSQVGFSAGVRIAKNIGERFILKTGFNYSQINEHLKFINTQDVKTVTVITTRTVTSGGQTVTISDTTTVTQIGTSYYNYYNRYRTIDLPLILSYEFGNSRNLSVAISAGPIFNLTSWYSGKILDTSFRLVDINTSGTQGVNAWKKNIGMGLYGSLSISKRLNDQMQLFFEPYIRYNFKPVNINETIVKQKYMTTGLQVGIRYNLFHNRQRYVE